mmetsp:Transcript_18882/g.57070  ORF Transcript_18882/g.57070 Transcript_18882/m.57070 type:complete len:210 (+) Transcript_18882:631-1260(+)
MQLQRLKHSLLCVRVRVHFVGDVLASIIQQSCGVVHSRLRLGGSGVPGILRRLVDIVPSNGGLNLGFLLLLCQLGVGFVGLHCRVVRCVARLCFRHLCVLLCLFPCKTGGLLRALPGFSQLARHRGLCGRCRVVCRGAAGVGTHSTGDVVPRCVCSVDDLLAKGLRLGVLASHGDKGSDPMQPLTISGFEQVLNVSNRRWKWRMTALRL